MPETAAQASPLLFDDLPIRDLGTISIRVFVLPPKPKKGNEKQAALPLDVEEGEEFMLDLKGQSPVAGYLESARGKRCVVYLVNGQRQEVDDNTFIVQELGFRYLRSRMIIMIDVDGLAPEAIGRLMQGSRQGFYKGAVREAITKRIVATLKSDPDLEKLELEAEEAVSELSAGDEKVKQTLDQLIDSHHDKGHSFTEGVGSAGDTHDGDELGFKTVVKGGVVTLMPPNVGIAAEYPVLTSQPAASIIRLRPNQPREYLRRYLPFLTGYGTRVQAMAKGSMQSFAQYFIVGRMSNCLNAYGARSVIQIGKSRDLELVLWARSSAGHFPTSSHPETAEHQKR